MNRRAIGAAAEEKAARYIETLGYEIIDRNYYGPHGELDIIAWHEGFLVFLEIKYRRDSRLGEPWQAVDYRKRQRIFNTAKTYMIRHKLSMQTPCRFDVVSVSGDEITLYQNAFGIE